MEYRPRSSSNLFSVFVSSIHIQILFISNYKEITINKFQIRILFHFKSLIISLK